jgi:hypothetical protein
MSGGRIDASFEFNDFSIIDSGLITSLLYAKLQRRIIASPSSANNRFNFLHIFLLIVRTNFLVQMLWK